ncbi:MAG: dephospho-CoA kinase [Clostridia bacterium]|nr:dephospho-CoA kinase [Clostridia bacterium]
MYIISVSGKSGSGKSKFSRDLAISFANDAIYIDMDEIEHKSMEQKTVIQQAIQIWGTGILNEDGTLNRKGLGKIVFSSKEEMEKLIDISYPTIKKLFFEIIEKSNKKIAVVDWAMIPKAPEIFSICNLKVLIKANIEIRKKRVLLRDHISEEYFTFREEASIIYDEDDFDIVILNEEVDNDLAEKIELVHHIVFDLKI